MMYNWWVEIDSEGSVSLCDPSHPNHGSAYVGIKDCIFYLLIEDKHNRSDDYV